MFPTQTLREGHTECVTAKIRLHCRLQSQKLLKLNSAVLMSDILNYEEKKNIRNIPSSLPESIE